MIFDQLYQFAALRPVPNFRKRSEQSQCLNIFTSDRHSPSLTRNIASYGKTANRNGPTTPSVRSMCDLYSITRNQAGSATYSTSGGTRLAICRRSWRSFPDQVVPVVRVA